MADESKHTPGPWEWARGCAYRNPDGDSWGLFGGDTRVHSDGSACGEYGPDIDVHGPDARLMAAAPDLLADLQSIIAYLDADDRTQSDLERHARDVTGGNVTELEARVERARAAITKATGNADA